MAITYDPAKRAVALAERQLDFDDAKLIFAGDVATFVDDRFDYGETRFVTAGLLKGRMVVIIWTPRGDDHHVISMRHCHAKEEKRWRTEIGFQIEAGFRKDADG